MIGTVLRIERASIHDGPGIRTVVFLKGCPLRCAWCSTPESQRFTHQKGLNIIKCAGCGECVKACPQRAITLVNGKAEVDNSKCIECLKCVSICPNEAFISYGTQMAVSGVVKEIIKDQIFFFHSGGGLTLSGGEPLSQACFTAEILRQTKQHAINTAIETSFFAPFEDIAVVLPWLDYLYVDIKHTDPKVHKLLTGVDNGIILDNISRISGSGYKGSVTVRVPLIPGINDGDENMLSTAAICAGISQLDCLELLPYHRIGTGTYQYLGLDYKLKDISTPSKEYVDERAAFIMGNIPGLHVKAGG